jgi:hypothetical protein
MNKISVALSTAAIGLIALSTAHGQGTASCDRACLKGFSDQFFDALAAHDPAKLATARNVKYTENSAIVKLGEGFWKTAGGTVPYRLEVIDPDSGNIAVQTVVQEGDRQVIYLARLRIQERKVSEIETMLVRKESSPLFAPENLKEVQPSFTMSIRKAEQNSRLELMAAADAYWRAFETNGTPDYHPAPFMVGANRSENGVQTTNRSPSGRKPRTAAEQFDTGGFPGRRMFDRRYPVVDTEKGVVLSIVRFGRRPDADPAKTPQALEDSAPLVAEIFAVKAGLIQDIQVVMLAIPKDQLTNWPVPSY